jgi:outer membrane lipoprotein SlyB
MKSTLVRTVIVLSAVATLSACVIAPPRYARAPANPAYPVYPTNPAAANPAAQSQYGVVSGIERLAAERQTTGGGAVTGGVTGAVIGRQFGGSGEGRALGTFLGAVAGILIGNQVERQNFGLRDGVRVVVQLDNGAQRSFDFTHAGDMRVGDRVRIDGQQLVRM